MRVGRVYRVPRPASCARDTIDARRDDARDATDAFFSRSCTLSFSDAKMQHTLKKVEAEVKAEL